MPTSKRTKERRKQHEAVLQQHDDEDVHAHVHVHVFLRPE
jgi:hypothetical protein